jgi:hypothetical protein
MEYKFKDLKADEMKYKFRDLKADEIDVRVAQVTQKGVTLLLYKSARVDMDILDETVGPMNWQREHKELKNNIYCGISIWDDEKKQWITKWDCGKESFTEAEKGESSDSFKRSGFNWGIGRELYTSPLIWVKKEDVNFETINGKETLKDKFTVEKIAIENKVIVGLAIKNKAGDRIYKYVADSLKDKKGDNKDVK